MFSTVVGFICNVVHPLFTEWNRLLVSPLSLLLLDNLQANLRRWQSVSTDNVSLLTAADSSDDSSPSNADQGDRHLLSVSGEIVAGKPQVVYSDGGRNSGSQTENILRRASMPPLSATASAGVTVRRGSSPAVGSQHVSWRRVYFLSSLAEDTAPVIALPSAPCYKLPNTTTEFDISMLQYNEGLNSVCKNGHKDVILADNNVCLPTTESRHCSLHADSKFQFSERDSTPVIYANDNVGSSGALLNGVSLTLPKFTGIRRGSAPVTCSARLPAARVTRRGSAPSPGAKLTAVSLWTSKLPCDTEPSVTRCHQPSVVLVESPHFNVAADQLSLVCLLTNNSTLKVPLERHGGRCREKRSHSAHAIVISPARFVERRSSSPLSLSTVGMPAT